MVLIQRHQQLWAHDTGRIQTTTKQRTKTTQ
jgi:hypothetical protein